MAKTKRCSKRQNSTRHTTAATSENTPGAREVFWARSRCSGHGPRCSGGVLGTHRVFWRRARCSGGVLRTLQVFWQRAKCSGGVLRTLQVFWRRARCSGGVLDTDTSVLDTDTCVLDVLEVFWMTPRVFGRLRHGHKRTGLDAQKQCWTDAR